MRSKDLPYADCPNIPLAITEFKGLWIHVGVKQRLDEWLPFATDFAGEVPKIDRIRIQLVEKNLTDNEGFITELFVDL